MAKGAKPVAAAAPPLALPPAAPSLEAEVVRLRRMVQAMAEMLVECGVVDPSMVEGRLHLAASAASPSEAPPRAAAPEEFSLKPVGLWARLFKRKAVSRVDTGAVPSAVIPADQTVPVEKLPFEVQSLYDEGGASRVGSAPKKSAPLEQTKMGTCNRCWRRAPVNSGSLCARCAVNHG